MTDLLDTKCAAATVGKSFQLQRRGMFGQLAGGVLVLAAAMVTAVQPAAATEGQAGTFEAVAPVKAADPNFRQMFMSWKQLDMVERGSIAIPSAMPVEGTNLTSGFGVRSDPFQRRAAMHAGVDLAGPVGTKIYATADGIVGRSKWVNGYGNLVEIDHGHAIQTRYGHLSRSLVKPGQRIRRGDLIALMGSTGRSTGSHLHYEVRLNGNAVNPLAFLQTNDYLAALQRRTMNPTKVAMGGPAGGAK